MNLHTYNQENGKKYKMKVADQDYSETNPRTREEFAKEFIRAYDGAVKNMKSGTRGRPLDDLLEEAYKYIEEEKKNGRY